MGGCAPGPDQQPARGRAGRGRRPGRRSASRPNRRSSWRRGATGGRRFAGLYRVPLHMIGDLERATFSNIEAPVAGVRQVHLDALAGADRAGHQARPVRDFRGQAQRILPSTCLTGCCAATLPAATRPTQTVRQNGWLNANEWRAMDNTEPDPRRQGHDVSLAAGEHGSWRKRRCSRRLRHRCPSLRPD